MVVALILLAGLLATLALAASGDLDSSFAEDGQRTLDFGGSDSAEAAIVQPDGKILVAGAGNANDDLAIVRLRPDGSLDPSFDGDGVFGLDFGGVDRAYGIALQEDGKLIAVGGTEDVDDTDVALVRLHRDGSLDRTFDGDGKRTLDFGGYDEAYDVLVQPDGRIVVAGTGNANADIAVVRLRPDGSLDPTFDGDGIVGVNIGGIDEGNAVALQSDGKLVVAGAITVSRNTDVTLTRLNRDGSLDATFGQDGKQAFNFAGSDVAWDVLVQPDGRIVLSGAGNPNKDVLVVRLLPGGTLDTSFDRDGGAAIDFGGDDAGYAVALQRDGRLVVAGTAGGDARLLRLNSDGSLDASFDRDGRRTIDLGHADDSLEAVALQADGKIVAAGRGGMNVQVVRVEGDPPQASPPPPSTPPSPAQPRTVPRCSGKAATIVGTAGRDRLVGTRRRDVIVALGGDDQVSAGGGDDLVCGGSGDDAVNGGGGNDVLRGGAGADRLAGHGGRDALYGGAGRDALGGGPGSEDRCLGGPGVDTAARCEANVSVP